MKKNEIKQQLKNEALNKIIKLYGNNAGKLFFDRYDPASFSEQRDYMVEDVVDNLKKDLKDIK